MARELDELDDEADDESEHDELPRPRSFSSAPKRGGEKGHLMSIMAKLKKLHPAYWVLGLGGVALTVDYFMEGDQSIASSLYRGVFGGSGSGGDGGGGGGAARRRVLPHGGTGMSPAIPGMGYAQMPEYYPAYPPSYGLWPGHYPRFASHMGHGWGHEGHGWGHEGHGFGHGVPVQHAAAQHGTPAAHAALHGSAHVRGDYPWV